MSKAIKAIKQMENEISKAVRHRNMLRAKGRRMLKENDPRLVETYVDFTRLQEELEHISRQYQNLRYENMLLRTSGSFRTRSGTGAGLGIGLGFGLRSNRVARTRIRPRSLP